MIIKKTVGLIACLFSVAAFAASNCPQATVSSHPNFCHSFKVSAECHCSNSGLPKGMCTNMSTLYNRMISTFGTLQRACEFQRNTPAAVCIEDWNCYRLGGKNSNGLCSSTGRACE